MAYLGLHRDRDQIKGRDRITNELFARTYEYCALSQDGASRMVELIAQTWEAVTRSQEAIAESKILLQRINETPP